MRTSLVAVALMLLVAGPVVGADLDHVRLIQELAETPVLAAPGYGEFQFRYQDWDGATSFMLGGMGGYLVMPSPVGGMDVTAFVGFASVDPDQGEGESGLLDIDVVGKYQFMQEPTKLTGGLLVSLPIGEKKIDQGTFDIELFGATRYDLETVCLEGHFGLRINGDVKTEYENPWTGETEEVKQDGEVSIKIGGGVLVPVSPTITMLGELTIETAQVKNGEEDIRLTPGVDVRLNPNLGFRGGLALGISDGAPDFEFIGGAAINWGG